MIYETYQDKRMAAEDFIQDWVREERQKYLCFQKELPDPLPEYIYQVQKKLEELNVAVDEQQELLQHLNDVFCSMHHPKLFLEGEAQEEALLIEESDFWDHMRDVLEDTNYADLFDWKQADFIDACQIVLEREEERFRREASYQE